MRKIKKGYKLKAVFFLIMVLFVLNSTVYGIDLSKKYLLRVPMSYGKSTSFTEVPEREEHDKNFRELKEGEKRRGKVVRMLLRKKKKEGAYGALVDIDGVLGLLHITRVPFPPENNDLRKDIEAGDEILVRISSINIGTGKVELALVPEYDIGELENRAMKAIEEGNLRAYLVNREKILYYCKGVENSRYSEIDSLLGRLDEFAEANLKVIKLLEEAREGKDSSLIIRIIDYNTDTKTYRVDYAGGIIGYVDYKDGPWHVINPKTAIGGEYAAVLVGGDWIQPVFSIAEGQDIVIESLLKGDELDGKVIKIISDPKTGRDYAALVDIGGVSGLLNINNLAILPADYDSSPIVETDDEVRVRISHIDKGARRIRLKLESWPHPIVILPTITNNMVMESI